MRYRVVIVYDKETGRVCNYRVEYRRWWQLFWKTLVCDDPRGAFGSYNEALLSIARHMTAPGGCIKVTDQFV